MLAGPDLPRTAIKTYIYISTDDCCFNDRFNGLFALCGADRARSSRVYNLHELRVVALTRAWNAREYLLSARESGELESGPFFSFPLFASPSPIAREETWRRRGGIPLRPRFYEPSHLIAWVGSIATFYRACIECPVLLDDAPLNVDGRDGEECAG